MNHRTTRPPAPTNEEPELTPERDIPTEETSTEEPPEPDDESVAGEEDPGAALEPPP